MSFSSLHSLQLEKNLALWRGLVSSHPLASLGVSHPLGKPVGKKPQKVTENHLE